jgi:hypothetical protein
MTAPITYIIIDCAAAKPLAGFWAVATGYRMGKATSSGMARLDHPTGAGPSLIFREVDEDKRGKNRIHLDLEASDLDTEVSTLLGLGAAQLATHDEDGRRWAVLSDPEGNEFCVAAAP